MSTEPDMSQPATTTKVFRYGYPTWSLAATALVVTVLTWPGDSTPSVAVPHVDLAVHAVLFAGWAAALIWDLPWLRAVAWLVPAALGFGLITELLQASVASQRSFAVLDLVADVVGATVAVLIVLGLRRRRA